MRTSLENQAAIKVNIRPLKFECASCHGGIIVKYLQLGEEAQCPYCGKINRVPENAAETDEKPDYARIRAQIARGNNKQGSAKKLLSTKRLTGSALVAWLVTSILHSMNHESNPIIGFIITVMATYMIEYLFPSKVVKRKLTREIAGRTQFCYVCGNHIGRGQLCYSEFDWRSYLAKTGRYYCLKCYEEIFMTPEPPIDKLKQPKRKFRWLAGNYDN